MSVLIFVLVVTLLIADSFIFFVLGVVVSTGTKVKQLKAAGWTIEPPQEGTE